LEIRSKIGILFLILCFGIIALTVLIYNYSVNIEKSFPRKIGEPTSNQNDEKKPVVYFGVISRYTPNIIYKGYQPIMDYLTDNTSYKFELKLSNSYQETLRQLVDEEVSAAFFGTFIYLEARKLYDIEPILKPLNEDGQPFFQSALITKSSSEIFNISDLRNKKLALPSKQSFSGNWLPQYELSKYGLTLSDLDSIHNFLFHHTVVHQVQMGNFDAGIVKDRVAKEFIQNGIRIFAYSDPRSSSPIVANKDHDKKVIKEIKDALLKIDVNDPNYKDLVKNWDKEFSNGFVDTKPSDFDSIDRIMQANGQ